jgi:hypothetical protein
MTGRAGQGRPGWPRMALCALILAAAGGAACSNGDVSPPAKAASATTAGAADTAVAGPAGALEDAYVAVLQRVRPSVVEISTGSGLGSGVVYDTKGNIVTNAHVVGEATRFSISLVDGRSRATPEGDWGSRRSSSRTSRSFSENKCSWRSRRAKFATRSSAENHPGRTCPSRHEATLLREHNVVLVGKLRLG